MRACLLILVLGLLTGCSGSGAGAVLAVDAACPDEQVFFVGGAVSNPMLIVASKVQPAYPEDALTEGIEGSVILQMVISSVGAVCDLRLQSVSPAGWGFDAAAIAAVRQWRYEPALRDGVPVAVNFTVFVEFNLH